MNDISKWKPLVLQHLGKRLWHRWVSIALDILVVDLGIKPAFLFDYGHVTAALLLELLSSAYSRGLIATELCVVCVEMDFIVVGQKVFQAKPFASLFEKLIIVDVSNSLTRPEIIHSKEQLETTFEQFNECKCFTEKTKTVKISPNCKFNPSTLFGLLLGYPVVYWYDMDVDSANNCLSMEMLSCHKVVGILNQDIKGTSGHNIFSFSFPEQLQGHSLIQSWFNEIQHNTEWRILFKDIIMTIDKTKLSCVCL